MHSLLYYVSMFLFCYWCYFLSPFSLHVLLYFCILIQPSLGFPLVVEECDIYALQWWCHITTYTHACRFRVHGFLTACFLSCCSSCFWLVWFGSQINHSKCSQSMNVWPRVIAHTYTCNLHNGEHHEFFIKYLIRLLPFLLCLVVSFSFSDWCRP